MKILYICASGGKGAAAESYGAVKWLRALGCEVSGLFVVTGPSPSEELYDPDRIGDIRGVGWARRDDPSLLEGDFDIAVGKGHEAAWLLRKRSDIPTVYLTAGVEYVSLLGIPAQEVWTRPSPQGVEVRAMMSTDRTIVHSDLDMDLYRRLFQPDLVEKIAGDVLFASSLAAPDLKGKPHTPYAERTYDLCFSALDWGRLVKNRPMVHQLCAIFSRYRIVVCGLDFDGSKYPNVDALGLIPRGRMVDVLEDSRVVVIPSVYDPSPNLYCEAVLSGCNIVASVNVGNLGIHPSEMICRTITCDDFHSRVSRVLSLQRQAAFRILTSEWTAVNYLERLENIIEKVGLEKGSKTKRRFPRSRRGLPVKLSSVRVVPPSKVRGKTPEPLDSKDEPRISGSGGRVPILSTSQMEIRELRCFPNPVRSLQQEVRKREKAHSLLNRNRPLVVITSSYRFMARTIRLVDPLLPWFRFQVIDDNSTIPSDADLVWSLYPFRDGLLGARIKAERKIPFLLTLRGQFWHLNSGLQDMGIMSITQADRVVVLAKSLARSLVRRYPQFQNKCVVKIPNGGFPELSKANTNGFNLTAGMKKPFILCTTNFHFLEKRKGVDDLVLALDQAGFEGTFIVASNHGPYAPSKEHLGRCGRYIGFVGDRAGLYQAADLFLYMSDMDAQPSVLMEALSAGLPVVVGRVETSGAEEFIVHGESGLIFDKPSEGVEMALGLLRDQSRVAKIGAAARRSIEEVYTWEKMAFRYRSLMMDMIS